jgi:sigma-54 dependent transcriptional regulator
VHTSAAVLWVMLLLLGETGTGKKLNARAIHDARPRRHQRFVAVNCAVTEPTATSTARELAP